MPSKLHTQNILILHFLLSLFSISKSSTPNLHDSTWISILSTQFAKVCTLAFRCFHFRIVSRSPASLWRYPNKALIVRYKHNRYTNGSGYVTISIYDISRISDHSACSTGMELCRYGNPERKLSQQPATVQLHYHRRGLQPILQPVTQKSKDRKR